MAVKISTLNGTAGLEYLLNQGTVFNFRINMTNAGFAYALVGRGYVSGADFTFTGEDPINQEVKIRVSGAISETAL